jgi:hypothetical protein
MIGTQVRSRKLKNGGEFDVLRRRGEGVPKTDVHLNLDSSLLQARDQNNPHAAIIEILADVIPFDSVGHEFEPVGLNLDVADVAEDPLEPLDTAIATSMQVEVTCGAIRTTTLYGK